MSDGEATPDGDIDISPAAETRAEATNGQIHDAMPLVTANRDAPEGIAPAHRNGSGRHSRYSINMRRFPTCCADQSIRSSRRASE